MANANKELFDRARTVPIVSVLEHLGLREGLKASGDALNLKGKCPIHKGSNATQFVVTPSRNLFKCFAPGCASGSPIDLVAALRGVTIAEAATLLNDWFALTPSSGVPFKPQPTERTTMSDHAKPSHKVYTVEDRVADDSSPPDHHDTSWWTRIGSAWPHKDGKGFNILLSALPVSGRITLREYTKEDEEKELERKRARAGK